MDLNKIYYGDAIELSKQLPNNFVDLVVTSPPYCNLKNYGKKINILSPRHYNEWFLPLAVEIGRSIKDTGSFILNINDKVVGGYRDLYVFELVLRICNETDLKLYDRYIWHKKNAMPVSGDRLNDWMEYVFHFTKNNKIKSNIDRVRQPYAASTIKRYKSPVAFNKKVDEHGITSIGDKKMVKQNPLGKKPSTVMRFNNAGVLKGGGAGKHPAPFHPDLPEFFIKWLTEEGDIVLDPFAGCYDSNTRVMTDKGLKLFKDVENDNIMTLDPINNNIEYHRPIKYYKYLYSGLMYEIKNKSCDLLITPNHNMFIRETHKNEYDMIRVDELKYRTYRIPITGKWNGEDVNCFYLPEHNNGRNISINTSELKIDIEIWLAFMGLYLSEGCIGGTKKQKKSICYITQKIDRPEIRKVLDNLPFSYKRYGMKYCIYSTRLCNYLQQFGKAHDKFIPSDIKNLNKNLLRIFMNHFVLGDGSVYTYSNIDRKIHIQNKFENFTGRYYENMWTCSSKLKDDLIEILIKLGFNATFNYRRGVFSIVKSLSKERRIDTKSHINEVYYNDFVYCLTVPNHVMMIERNGKLLWCGNSGTVPYVCKKLNRQYIGFELNESYKELIDNRLL